MIVGDSLQIGMMASETKQMIHCTEASLWKGEKKGELTDCTASLDSAEFRNRLKTSCHRQETCTVSI